MINKTGQRIGKEMRKELLEKLSDEEFRRLAGVKKGTYVIMSEVLQKAHIGKKARGGRENKLSIESMLLMTFEYLREYRTYFHIG